MRGKYKDALSKTFLGGPGPTHGVPFGASFGAASC